MNLRKITLLLTAPTLIVVAGLTAWSWLLHSEPGARWLLTRLDSSIPGSVSTTTISGDLGSGLQLDGLHFEDGNTRVDIGQLNIALNIDLLPPAATIETLQADSVAIRVRDRGVGIPKADQRRIFEKFVRGESAKTLGVPGTGIGLAVAQRIIAEHGGDIRLESEPGAGSTFIVVLPAVSSA